MGLTVRFGEGVEARSEDRTFVAVPDRAVATLLLGLLAADGAWVSRREAARRLYPDADPATAQNALRQALFRLRRWLGEDVVESAAGRLRSAPGAVSPVWEGADVCPIDHPWAEAIWSERRRGTPAKDPFAEFARYVESAAEFDRDAARGVFVGGSSLVAGLHHKTALRLLRLTAPESVRSPFAFEHLLLRGDVELQAMALDRSTATYTRAYRLALHLRSAAKAAQAAAMATFAHLEAGSMTGAEAWLDRYARYGRGDSPLGTDVRGAFLWNSNRTDEAVALMRESRPRPDADDPLHCLHYWKNLAVLAAEAGDVELALQAEEEARRLAKPEVHLVHIRTLEVGRASRLMAQGSLEEAIVTFQRVEAASGAAGDAATRSYAVEGRAEALARSGDLRRAAAVWAEAEAGRHAGNLRLTPRLAARKARVLRLA